MSIATTQTDLAGGAAFGDMPPIGPPTQQIIAMLGQRKADMGHAHEVTRIMAQAYDSEIAVASPELDKTEPLSVANLLCQGIDQYGLRVATTQPEVSYFSTRPGQAKADNAARLKRRVTLGWWDVNNMPAVDEKRARQLVAYARAPVMLRPSYKLRQPVWETRTALETYPSTPLDSLDIHPHDAIFCYLRSFGWLQAHYPAEAVQIGASRKQGEKLRPDDVIEIIEYVDDEARVLIAAGQGQPNGAIHEAEYGLQGAVIYNLGLDSPNHWAVELLRVRNRAGISPVVIPSRISLNSSKGQFDDALGIFGLLAKMQAMNVNAIAKGIWPDLWLLHEPNQTGRVLKVANGIAGQIGEITGGKLQPITEQPSPQVMNMLNYLERAIRLDASMPAEFGGESPSNVRTDRRGLTVEGATVDFFIAAYQSAMARSKKKEIEIAQAIDMAYFKNTRKSFFVDWPGAKGRVDYRPRETWGDGARDVSVSYAYLGMDVNAATVRQGQLVGMGAMSLDTVRRQSPDVIQDPEQERGRVWGDQLDKVIMAQMSQPGALSIPDAATVKRLVIGGAEIEDAIDQVQKAAQVRQASSGPPGSPEGAVAPGSPDAQPGLAQPGQGQEQPTIPQEPAGLDNYRGILQELGKFRGAATAAGG